MQGGREISGADELFGYLAVAWTEGYRLLLT